jgi:ATP-dependent Lon protease
MRNIAQKVLGNSSNLKDLYSVDEEMIEKVLGHKRFRQEFSERNLVPGIAIGLATSGGAGGSLLFIETSQMKGKGSLILSGKLGDVIQESARLAMSYIRANADRLGLGHVDFLGLDVAIHFPAGAQPKVRSMVFKF